MHPHLTRILAAAAAAGLVAGAAQAQQGRSRRAPPAAAQSTQPPADPGATAAAALLLSQPLQLDLMRNELGWLKQCGDPQRPADCTVFSGFAVAPATPNTLEVRFSTLSKAGTHTVQVLVPLEVNLRPGLAISIGDGQAAVGTYASCSLVGCLGEVVLTDASYDAMLSTGHVDVVISGKNERTVALQVPLDGFKEAAAGKAISPEELDQAKQAAVEKMKAVIEARQAQQRARQAEAQPRSAEPAVPAGSADVPAAPQAAAPPAESTEPAKP